MDGCGVDPHLKRYVEFLLSILIQITKVFKTVYQNDFITNAASFFLRSENWRSMYCILHIIWLIMSQNCFSFVSDFLSGVTRFIVMLFTCFLHSGKFAASYASRFRAQLFHNCLYLFTYEEKRFQRKGINVDLLRTDNRQYDLEI